MSAATTNLKEPDQLDWDKAHKSSSWTPPPPAKDANGTYIVYTAVLPRDLGAETRRGMTNEGYRKFEFGPLTLELGAGRTAEIRFFSQSLKQFMKKDGTPMNMNGVAKVLRAAGFTGKPQRNTEYERAVGSISGRKIQVTIEWEARDRDSGEEVRGYDLFPDDPERPGQKKAILRKGDKLADGTEVRSEVLFANPRVRFVEGR